ncbi:MAG: hypothetical protein Q8K81_08355 [Sulfuricurvum sp.]|nr:hypothetical protein [Sulfuricurvum sp.]
MNSIEEQLIVLDEQLETYDPTQRWFIYLVTGIGILAMSWMFFVSDMLDQLSTLQNEHTNLITQIQQSSPEAYQAKITHTTQMILEKKRMIVDIENQKQALLIQISQSQGLLFDNRQYAEILDLLLERSVQLGLNIELIQSEDTDKVFFGKVKQFKKLTIKGSANFREIVAFLTFIEEQKSLVVIDNVQIHSDEEKPVFEATVLYMGVAL